MRHPPTFVAAILVGCSTGAAIATAQHFPRDRSGEPSSIGETLPKSADSVLGKPAGQPDADMRQVLDALAKLGPKSIATLTPELARQQPSPADAVAALLKQQGQEPAAIKARMGVTTRDVSYPGAESSLPARIYRPEGAASGQALPVVLYFHGGGWVIADIETYDAAPRAMARSVNAIVVSADYRLAPEHKFPAAHEDAVAAYKWVLANAAQWGADPRRIAVMGESAGGNLAINVAIAARDQNLQMPTHQVLVYPVAGVDMNTPSYLEYFNAVPLNKPMMAWFIDKVVRSDADKQDARIDLVGRADLKALPPATVITAEIDPLLSEGQQLAEKLQQAGVQTQYQSYAGVTHEFFGMAAVVGDAKSAQDLAAAALQRSFDSGPSGSAGSGAGSGTTGRADDGQKR